MFALVCVSLLVPLALFAQEAETASEGDVVEPMQVMDVVATTELYNAQIESVNGSEVTLTFDLYNAQGVQPGVVYGLELYEVNEDGTAELIDSHVYRDDVHTLGTGETVPLRVTYNAPSFLSGTYDLLLLAENQAGLLLALAPLGEVALAGSGDYVELSDCMAQVDGYDKTYELTYGVDVAARETLLLNCTASNMTGSDQTLTPAVSTYERTLSGATVGDVEELVAAPVVLATGATEDITVVVPKATTPQSYDAVVTLTAAGNVLSNEIVVHYVLSGKSATIQNALFDQQSYEAGDTAAVQVFWTGAADDYLNSRHGGTDVGNLTLALDVSDASGAACAEPFTIVLNNNENVSDFLIPITAACVSPVLDVQLSDATGAVLAESGYEYGAGEAPAEPDATPTAQPEQTSGDSSAALLTVFIALVVVVVVVVLLMRANKRPQPNTDDSSDDNNTTPPASSAALGLVLTLVLAGGLFGVVAPRTADAVTFRACHICFADGTCECRGTFTMSTNKGSYSVNEPVSVAATVRSDWCSNGVPGFQTSRATAVDGLGTVRTVLSTGAVLNASRSASLVGYPTPGAKTMNVRGTYYSYIDEYLEHNGVGSASIALSVYEDGACGGATSGTYSSAPSTDLCLSSAAATGMTVGVGSYTWTCPGTAGGANASCSATRQVVTNAACGTDGVGQVYNPTYVISDFCAEGSVTGLTDDGSLYTWTCDVPNPGVDASCSAYLSPTAVGTVNEISTSNEVTDRPVQIEWSELTDLRFEGEAKNARNQVIAETQAEYQWRFGICNGPYWGEMVRKGWDANENTGANWDVGTGNTNRLHLRVQDRYMNWSKDCYTIEIEVDCPAGTTWDGNACVAPGSSVLQVCSGATELARGDGDVYNTTLADGTSQDVSVYYDDTPDCAGTNIALDPGVTYGESGDDAVTLGDAVPVKRVTGDNTTATTENEAVAVTHTASGDQVTLNYEVPGSGAGVASVTLDASPTTISAGESSTLTWDSTNAASCSAVWTAKTTPDDSQLVSGIITTRTFTIDCDGATDSATVTVSSPLTPQ